MGIKDGVYETIINQALEAKLKQFDENVFHVEKTAIDKAEASGLHSRAGMEYPGYWQRKPTHNRKSQSQANSYRDIFGLFEPKILVGLTATPERMDGQSLLPDFCDKIAAEIRLPDALKLKLLTPFHYFCITDDSVDLRKVRWTAGKYDATELSRVLITNTRTKLIVEAIHHYLTDPYQCKALCFCSTREHAEYMSQELNNAGFKAIYLVNCFIPKTH